MCTSELVDFCFLWSPRFVPAAEAGSPEREEEKEEEEVTRVDDRRLQRLRERQVSGHTRRCGPVAISTHTHTITHIIHCHTSHIHTSHIVTHITHHNKQQNHVPS